MNITQSDCFIVVPYLYLSLVKNFTRSLRIFIRIFVDPDEDLVRSSSISCKILEDLSKIFEVLAKSLQGSFRSLQGSLRIFQVLAKILEDPPGPCKDPSGPYKDP